MGKACKSEPTSFPTFTFPGIPSSSQILLFGAAPPPPVESPPTHGQVPGGATARDTDAHRSLGSNCRLLEPASDWGRDSGFSIRQVALAASLLARRLYASAAWWTQVNDPAQTLFSAPIENSHCNQLPAPQPAIIHVSCFLDNILLCCPVPINKDFYSILFGF